MAACAVLDGGAWVFDAAAPEFCAGYLLISPSEYAEWVAVQGVSISPAQASDVAGAILLVWATGWAFRVVARHLQSLDSERVES
jgi:hypothetical protein